VAGVLPTGRSSTKNVDHGLLFHQQTTFQVKKSRLVTHHNPFKDQVWTRLFKVPLISSRLASKVNQTQLNDVYYQYLGRRIFKERQQFSFKKPWRTQKGQQEKANLWNRQFHCHVFHKKLQSCHVSVYNRVFMMRIALL
jgi:hypothetical protein